MLPPESLIGFRLKQAKTSFLIFFPGAMYFSRRAREKKVQEKTGRDQHLRIYTHTECYINQMLLDL